jgi:glycerol-3-phosphate dehydrogenase (NAD(P)+)
MSTVAIIGAGMMGTAMTWPLADAGHTIRLVGTPLDAEIIRSIHSSGVHPRLQRAVPEGVLPFQADALSQAVQGADLIVSGVSSFGVDWFAEAAGPHLRPDVPVLSVTKGLEDAPDGGLEILPAALDRRLPAELRGRISLNAIGGPCIAHELAARRHTAVVFTGPDPSTLTHLRALLTTPYYHIWTSTDMVGVETCAALKNAYAMGVGLAVGMMEAAGPDGLAQGYNPQAALFGQACLEMRLLVAMMGGGIENVSWLPGAGDLYVTVFGGRTVALGKLLGQEKPFTEARSILAGQTLESVAIITRLAQAMPRLAARGLLDPQAFPLLLHMDAIVNHGALVDIPWERFSHSAPSGGC